LLTSNLNVWLLNRIKYYKLVTLFCKTDIPVNMNISMMRDCLLLEY